MKPREFSTKKLVLSAILTALVVVLQLMGAFIRFGTFSVSLVLIPIVIGAAMCGVTVGAWLGFVFGAVVLLSGDAAPFLALNIPGTVITVLAKGVGAGLAAGLVYKLVLAAMNKRSTHHICYIKKNYGLCEECEPGVSRFISRKHKYVAVFAAAIVCPIVNTGIFLLGCLLFFFPTMAAGAQDPSYAGNVLYYMIIVFVGFNFLFELGTNIILSPIVVRLLNIKNKE